RGGEEGRGIALRVPRSELAKEMGGAYLQGGGRTAGDGARDAWLARHAGGGDGAQRARGGGSTRARVGDDDAPELRQGGSGGERSPGEGPDCARGRQKGRGERRLNEKRLALKRFFAAVQRKNPE